MTTRCPLLPLLCAAAVCCLPAGRAADPPLRRWTCQEIRSLPRSEAAAGQPVLVRGVVTYLDGPGSCVVQDETEGIYVTGPASLFSGGSGRPPVPGTLLEIEGRTQPGGFAPTIQATRITRVGTAPLPPAPEARMAELRTGRANCQRVTIRGVARRTWQGSASRQMRLEVATLEGGFSVTVADSRTLDAARLVDADLQLTGVCFTFFTPRGELMGTHLRMNNAQDMRILQPATEDPFAVPTAQPFALRPYEREGPNLHRQRLAGVVTLASPGEYFYVHTGERGLRVHTRNPETLHPGDTVEVSGFVEMRRNFAEMQEALFRRTGQAPLPAPIRVTRQQVLSVGAQPINTIRQEDYDGTRITLRGTVLKLEKPPAGNARLYLDSDGGIVLASFAAPCEEDALTAFAPGSEVDATGICTVELSSDWPALAQPTPADFSLLLQSPEAITVLRTPGYWTNARLTRLLLATAAGLAAMLGIIVLLRRQVTRRTAELATEMLARQEQERARHDAAVEFDAVLRERERLANDLHDTLEQTLTGVALQLDASQRAPTPDSARRNLTLATQMLARGREDVRRNVWNLRALALDGRLLREALRETVRSTLDGTGISLTVSGTGEEYALPDLIGGNLLMITLEAVTNALKHAAPQQLDITADYQSDKVVLTIRDNGSGFSPASAPGPHDGHFGLTGMQERAARLGGTVHISSVPGTGTTITATLPSRETPAA